MILLYWAPISAILALLFALWLWVKVKTAGMGSPKMVEIAGAIQEGAMAFLKREYSYLALFVVVLGVVLAFTINLNGVKFSCRRPLSAAAGYIGMKVATECHRPHRPGSAEAGRPSVNPGVLCGNDHGDDGSRVGATGPGDPLYLYS